MKASNKILTAVIIITVAALAAYNVKAQGKIYKIGDRGPAGGWIFYDKGNSSDGWRYLEAAPEDQSKLAESGCSDKSITGAKGTAIGTGKSNTQAIVKGCAELNIAAKIAVQYRGGGKSDWFLPSKDELNTMYLKLHKAGIGGFSEANYWSSSLTSSNFAWGQYFGNGHQDYTFSNYFRPWVRAVRAF